jgi:microcystin-dependent protein
MTRIIEIVRRSGGAASAAASADRAETAANDAETALALIQAIGLLVPWNGQWLTATPYVVGDLVYQAGSTYICLVAHTSGTFNTDLSASRWQLFAAQGAAGGGTGDMLKSENLSGLSNYVTARANMGLTHRINKAGDVIFTIGSQTRDDAIKINGATISRATYADLWTYAQASGRLAATEGGKTAGEFGPGNGTTTFSMPDVRGYFARLWDDGRGLDVGRVLGSIQDAAMLNHTHSGTTSTTGNHTHGVLRGLGAAGIQGASGTTNTASGAYDINMSAAGNHAHSFTTGNPDAGGGSETRPINFNLMAWMVF